MIAPTFNQKVLDTFIPIFDKQSKILVKQLNKQIGSGEFEVHKYVSLCTLDMILGELFTLHRIFNNFNIFLMM